MTSRKTLGKGLIERIGLDGILNFTPAGKDKSVKQMDIPDHHTALGYALDSILDPSSGIISDIAGISAVAHRVVQGRP